jgi:hypothetical protein
MHNLENLFRNRITSSAVDSRNRQGASDTSIARTNIRPSIGTRDH